MKYIKILGLLAVAAAALMAFAGVASATTVTSPAGTKYLGELHASSEGHAILHNPIAKIECNSTVNGHVEVNGAKDEKGNTLPASGEITTLTFSPCTDDWHVTTVTPGTLSIVSNGNGTGDLFSNGATVESTRFGVSCRYKTNNTTIGTVTSAVFDKEGKEVTNATLHIQANIPFHSGSFLCGSGATSWTGSYIINSPKGVVID